MEQLIKDYLQEFGKDVGKPKGVMQNPRDSDSRATATPNPEGTRERKDTENQKRSPIERSALREILMVGRGQHQVKATCKKRAKRINNMNSHFSPLLSLPRGPINMVYTEKSREWTWERQSEDVQPIISLHFFLAFKQYLLNESI